MNTSDVAITNCNKAICDNISSVDERGLLSKNILSQLRNFVEAIMVKIYEKDLNLSLDFNYNNINNGIDYISSKGELKFLSKFHSLLQKSESHYTWDDDGSERLMLKYYEYLLRIKEYLKTHFHIDVLGNINEFPVNLDTTSLEYHREIASRIDSIIYKEDESKCKDRLYVQKTKPFFVDGKIYYEVTLSPANDYASKFDSIVAFTKFDITRNYAIKVSLKNAQVKMFNSNVNIKIIDNWMVSIRACEIKNFSKILGLEVKGDTAEAYRIMQYLTSTGHNILDLITMKQEYYEQAVNYIKSLCRKDTNFIILSMLEQCRTIVIKNMKGSNVIRYLLYKLNNKVTKNQYAIDEWVKSSSLYLRWGCIPFDEMPFTSSLIKHNVNSHDLFDCIDLEGKDYELLARRIIKNAEIKGMLYTNVDEIKYEGDLALLVEKYNSKLWYKHRDDRKLVLRNNYIFINSYEKYTIEIIEQLNNITDSGIRGYENTFDSWLAENENEIDDEDKKTILKTLFNHTCLSIIYGAAGTGKTKLITYISQIFSQNKKLFLANTNPAIDNLKRRVDVSECTFSTITKFLLNDDKTEYDLLIIDECSTVSNLDMYNVLKKAKYTLLILVGDIYQIESINFGNWFNIVKDLVNKNSIHELTQPFRTQNSDLLKLWSKVRNIDDDIIEHIARNNYSRQLDETIFTKNDDDEIILCLNYDGLYGINNINKFLQNSNNSDGVELGINTYKINDPILFNESTRFSPVIYNNLKGKILNIEKELNKIWFTVEVEKAINDLDLRFIRDDIELMGFPSGGKSEVRFYVDINPNSDDDDDLNSKSLVPFNIAYAVSIHKSQGLEYNSVKIVVTNEIEDLISHNIFYTAITRARNTLRIYWSPECGDKIIHSFKKEPNKKDVNIIKNIIAVENNASLN